MDLDQIISREEEGTVNRILLAFWKHSTIYTIKNYKPELKNRNIYVDNERHTIKEKNFSFVGACGYEVVSIIEESSTNDTMLALNTKAGEIIQELFDLDMVVSKNITVDVSNDKSLIQKQSVVKYTLNKTGYDSALALIKHHDEQSRFEQQMKINKTLKNNSSGSLVISILTLVISIALITVAFYRIDISNKILKNSIKALENSTKALSIANEQLEISQKRLELLENKILFEKNKIPEKEIKPENKN